jgi:hypothetical protein
MRIIAMVRAPDSDEHGLEALQRLLADHSLLPVPKGVEQTSITNLLIQDMSPDDLHRFRRTVRHLAHDPNGGTAASVSVLADRYLVLRLRNTTLQRLVPGGHALIEDIMREEFDEGGGFELHSCEVRERGHGEGFLYGTWRGGEPRFLRFLFGERRGRLIGGVFAIGAIIETALTFVSSTAVVDLLLRLGAPMLVSGLVLILERVAQWRDQLIPHLQWSTVPNLRWASSPWVRAGPTL